MNKPIAYWVYLDDLVEREDAMYPVMPALIDPDSKPLVALWDCSDWLGEDVAPVSEDGMRAVCFGNHESVMGVW